MKQAMSREAHERLTARRIAALEQGRREAECIIAREIQRVTGCTRSEALREAARLVAKDTP
jgi:hypothetical protein